MELYIQLLNKNLALSTLSYEAIIYTWRDKDIYKQKRNGSICDN